MPGVAFDLVDGVFAIGEKTVRAQRDGDWLAVFLDAEHPLITEPRLLGDAITPYLGEEGVEPAAAGDLAADIIRCAHALPERRRTGPDGRPATEVAAIDFLVQRVPELAPLIEAHLDDNHELLPYLVFDDFTRWFIEAVKAGNDDAARSFCEAVETLMATAADPPADDRVWNLTAVAFTEALVLGGEYEVIERAEKWLGPAAKKQIDYRRFG
jgi:hypothetical protein